MPNIDWADYNTSVPSGLIFRGTIRDPKKGKDDESNGEVTVRGRTFTQSKPETFNQVRHLISTLMK